ncbi:MAG: RHS repeat-associated core domain-containing protein, partial [Bacteroidota bacterium]
EVATGCSTIHYDYDTHGRLKGVNDPDAGVSTTEYNGFGEITRQQDGNDNIYTFVYDDAGRLETKTGPEGEYSYTYIPVTADSCGGLLSSTALNGESTTYAYTRHGQVLKETKVINGVNYVFNYGYDNKGNKLSITYPNGFGVKRIYDSDGRLITVNRADNQNTIWQVDMVNELGLPTLIKQGDNTLNTTYTYDNYYHLNGISNLKQNDTYVWDANNGNLSQRTNNIRNLTETFSYDDLNRLTEIKLNNVLVKEMDYEPNGNIASKTDAGEYLYDPVKIHAVKQIEGDENTAISEARQDVTYTAFNKIKTIVEQTTNGDSLVYLYGPDMQRNRMELYTEEELIKSRVYDGLYETEVVDNHVTQYCYVEGGFGITAVMINKNSSNTMYYLLRDQQGSITGLVDDQRTLVEEYSYDAWGRRRNPTTWAYDNTPVPQFMFRGYTMHEMLDEFTLINMNGRCYDPVVGRFLSPDIVIQDGNNTQCYNKYSYCVNNPLKYYDPSGWSYGLLNQTADNSQAAAYLQLRANLDRGWIEMNNMPILGFVPLNAGNALKMGHDEGQRSLTAREIGMYLSCFHLPGLFGNASWGSSVYNEPEGKGVNVNIIKIYNNVKDFKGCKGLNILYYNYTELNGEPGPLGVIIGVEYDAGCSGVSNYHIHMSQALVSDGVKKNDGTWDPKLKIWVLPTVATVDAKWPKDGPRYISFIDQPHYGYDLEQSMAATPAEHKFRAEISIYNRNNALIYTISYGFDCVKFGNGPYDYRLNPLDINIVYPH